MATLTAGEIEYIRMMSGDNCPDYDVSDAFMQTLHDRAEGITCGCTAQDDVTIVLVLRARVARAAKLFDEEGDGGSRSVSQKYTHLKELLEQWEKKCGLDTAAITISTFDTGMDSDCSGSEYTRYPYRGYWPWMGS